MSRTELNKREREKEFAATCEREMSGVAIERYFNIQMVSMFKQVVPYFCVYGHSSQDGEILRIMDISKQYFL
uniref:Uncharacterized protein n=1 Tax=Globisporangium ultimum (strain ATCC 200006 / CBS 805.95 / DAOM BR144) TaxID=431595 RepID=K3X770_GLOUD